MKSLGSSVSKIVAPVLGRRGFGEAQMIAEWSSVVGHDLARDTLPVKLSFARGERVEGTLHLRVTQGAALTVQHLEPIIIERINGFFGYKAVARLALRQGALPRRDRNEAPRLRELSETERTELERRLADIEDPELRAAMDRLGRAVLGSEAPGLHRGSKPDSV
ncbi:MAG TPA: DciA family protein [Aliidongia sp.]|nr:DciA family protein [Aliidongia sp.]